ncbi:branched-subunit amino acid transport protein [Orbus hercynius]|uniref:Branched-subunit amino acid transport protein n=1 Tax=Orbus hercynius TaxID=593135 RepID=A0A495RI62_9GAMM|nr:AzlD domain-containing protein [Orbus hercynius]RKS87223.1 branched-subunit amino acid transport protein [Orbus hercynius]
MEITLYSLGVILGCGVVTWLPRVIPFMLIRKINIPEVVLRFLSYVPLCILTALLVQNLLLVQEGQLPKINSEYWYASCPTVLAAILTKNLMWIVIVGIVSMSLVRYFA